MSDTQRISITIRESEWLRGFGTHNSGLKVGDRYCCMGIAARECGFNVHMLERFQEPSAMLTSVGDTLTPEQDHFRELVTQKLPPDYPNSPVNKEEVFHAMQVNDKRDLKERERREYVEKWMGALGFDVTWVLDETGDE